MDGYCRAGHVLSRCGKVIRGCTESVLVCATMKITDRPRRRGGHRRSLCYLIKSTFPQPHMPSRSRDGAIFLLPLQQPMNEEDGIGRQPTSSHRTPLRPPRHRSAASEALLSRLPLLLACAIILPLLPPSSFHYLSPPPPRVRRSLLPSDPRVPRSSPLALRPASG